MAVIHHTTLSPTKLELLAEWLPSRPWYQGATGTTGLAKAGGFRLDDPEGEVGIEFMVVTDAAGDEPVTYLVPLTYRGAPLDGAGYALIGTSEHGVLGPRWIYDGAHDPVLFDQLLALLEGRATRTRTRTTPPTRRSRSVAEGGRGGPGGSLTGPGTVDGHLPTPSLVTVGPMTGEGPVSTLTRVPGTAPRSRPVTGAGRHG